MGSCDMRLLIIILLVLYAGISFACDCNGLYQYDARLDYDSISSIIFLGEVAEIDSSTYQTVVSISEIIKGDFTGDTIVIDATSDCSKFINVNGQWIVYARRNESGNYYASMCGLTRSLRFEGWYSFPPNLSEKQLKRNMKSAKKENIKQAKKEIKLLRQQYGPSSG